MENYIVRIYRRDQTDPDKVAGTFESVENETRNGFTSLGSLVDLLTTKGRGNQNSNELVQTPEQATLSD